ncbi:hypothetical protein ACU686_19860 [Yinghuangia aomiensis]
MSEPTNLDTTLDSLDAVGSGRGAAARLGMIEVAERLFAERGVNGVSLREIGTQAASATPPPRATTSAPRKPWWTRSSATAWNPSTTAGSPSSTDSTGTAAATTCATSSRRTSTRSRKPSATPAGRPGTCASP